jgi:hypothetical protein
VLAALTLILPLGLGGAVSPVLLTEQTLLLAGPDGRRAGVRFTAGVVLTLLLVVGAVLVFGAAVSLPSEPRLDASLDLALGVVLIALAVLVNLWRGRGSSRGGHHDYERPHDSARSRAAFPFGVFSMATDFTTLALVVPAAKEISSADLDVVEKMVLVGVLVTLASSPAWAPVALLRVAPRPGRRILDMTGSLIARYGRVAVVALLGAAGLFFAGRGLIRLIG